MERNRARKEDLCLTENPETKCELDGHVVKRTFLGRVEISFKDDVALKDASVEEPQIRRNKMFFKPAPIPSLEWDTSLDGEEMFEMAIAAEIDLRRLLAAALDCANLRRHLVGKTRTAKRAFKAAEGFLAGP